MSLNLTTERQMLQCGLEHLLQHPDHVLPRDLKRVVWVLAQCATRAAAEENDLITMQAASDLAQAAEPSPEYITVSEASRLYGISTRLLRYHAKQKHFDAHKRGWDWYINAHDLAQWVSARGVRIVTDAHRETRERSKTDGAK